MGRVPTTTTLIVMPIRGVPGFYVRIVRAKPDGKEEVFEESNIRLVYRHISDMKGHLWPDGHLEALCKRYEVDEMVIYSHGPDPANEEGSVKFANWWASKGLHGHVMPLDFIEYHTLFIEPHTIISSIHVPL